MPEYKVTFSIPKKAENYYTDQVEVASALVNLGADFGGIKYREIIERSSKKSTRRVLVQGLVNLDVKEKESILEKIKQDLIDRGIEDAQVSSEETAEG